MYDALGIIGGLITVSSILPQLRKCAITKSTKDLSWGTLAVFYLGASFNITYGLINGNYAIYVPSTLSFITNTVLCYMKYTYESEQISYKSIVINTSEVQESSTDV